MNTGSVAREWSFLLYLNEHWTPSDGGHLRIHDVDGSGQHRDVAPEAGTLVLFKSDTVPHEVRPTTASRMAIVGWLHRHQQAPEVDEDSLSELGRALLEHYRSKGETIKLPSP
jgi:Rps23 Pro-64 3,4-dihydroxylase Tpa1-like proline 4-hydroxylase